MRPFDELLQGFKAGQVDVLLNLAKSDQRRTFADFSATHVVVGGAIFVHKGDERVRAEADLSGKSIIVLERISRMTVPSARAGRRSWCWSTPPNRAFVCSQRASTMRC